tara:strand:+ start:2972 stop:3439 length:468 start_codon:yes stop_codon:yes gene_type:complete
MPILGRNAGTSDLNLKEGSIVCQGAAETVSGNKAVVNTTGGRFQRFAFDLAARASIEVDEAGVTIISTGGGGDTDVVFYANTTPIASAIFNSASTALTEFTTRDGSLAWASGYENRADRVFPKGTIIQVGFGGNAHTNAMFTTYAVTKEAGAGPA